MFQRRVSWGAPLRLVVETNDPALTISDFVCFRQAGFDVTVCHGPDREHPCPAATGGTCAALDGADVVLNALRDAEVQRSVVDAVHAAAPGIPMVVSIAPGIGDDLPRGCVPLSRTMSVGGQVDAVRRAAIGARNVTPR